MRIFLRDWTLSGAKTEPLQVCVPCDVTNALYEAKKIVDPLFGKNAETLAWIAEEEWTFSCRFDVPPAVLKEERIRLCFDGVDTLSEISLNGESIGNTDNMFLRYDFDVKTHLREKNNELCVRLPSATRAIRERNDGTNYRSLFTQDRMYIRKMQCSWGWDWAPNLPGIGIWLPVCLEADCGATIENVRVDTFLSGDVRFILSFYNGGSHLFENKDGRYAVRVTVGETCVETPVTARVQLLNLKIDEPKLWWPNGYGEATLYEYKAELLKDGEVISEKTGTFGFREIALCQAPFGNNRSEFAFLVNGRKIFAKGSNWVPMSSLSGSIKDEAYLPLLLAAQECGFNMLRVWGGGLYEKDAFYETCDRLGIMVWQDFMFSCSAIPSQVEGLEGSMRKEAAYQIERLQNHPSIALWCGGNEYMPHRQGNYYDKGNEFVRVTLRGLCAELDPYRVYIHNSPVGLDDDEWRWTNGDAHVSCMDELLEGDAVYEYRKRIAEKETQFVSECAQLGPTRLRSIEKFIPQEELWPTGDSWEYHFVKNPYAIIPMTCLDKEKHFAEKFFGMPSDVRDFLKKAMIAHAELIRSEGDFARSNPHCKGFMNWMYNDIWGCGTWSLIDFYGEKKPVYYAMKRLFAPVYVCFAEHTDGLKLSVCNDTQETIEGELVWTEKTMDGGVVARNVAQVRVPRDGVVGVPVAYQGVGAYMSAEFLGKDGRKNKTIYFPKLWKELPFVSDVAYELRENEGGRYALKLRANAFARTVFLDYADNTGIVYSDNFFDMEKGEERLILIETSKAIDFARFRVRTFADVWED